MSIADFHDSLACAKALPRCEVCGKKSDGSREPFPHHVVCGTCYDKWLRSPERRNKTARSESQRYMDWTMRTRGEVLHGQKKTETSL